MGRTAEELKGWARGHLTWFGQSAFRISTDGGERIFIDPFRVSASTGPADLILVTHPHRDHYDEGAIAGLRRGDTVIVMPASCAKPGQRGIAPGQTERIGSVTVTGVPSHNVGKRFHPKSGAWLGYMLRFEGITVYHAGDTDPLPEMAGLRPDIALLPVGGMFTMGWRAAAQLCGSLGTGLAIPMHYNMLIGGRRAGERFAAAVGSGSLVLARQRR